VNGHSRARSSRIDGSDGKVEPQVEKTDGVNKLANYARVHSCRFTAPVMPSSIGHDETPCQSCAQGKCQAQSESSHFAFLLSWSEIKTYGTCIHLRWTAAV